MSTRSNELPAPPRSLSRPRPSSLNPTWCRRLKGLALPLLIVVALEFIVRIGWLPSYQMPAPSEIALTLTDLAEGALWKHIGASLLRVLLGFAIGASLALVFAAWVGLSREAEAYLEPTFAALRSIPSLAWVPLLLLWLGIDETSKIVLIAIGAFFRCTSTWSRRFATSTANWSRSGTSMASAAGNWCGEFYCPPPCPACSPGYAAA
jgi:sulfonate transport system permease protein